MTSARGRPDRRSHVNSVILTRRGPQSCREQQDHDRSREDADARVSRPPPHQVLLGRIDGKRQCRQPVRGEIHVENLHGGERQRKSRDHSARQQHDLADVAREQIHQVLLDVSKDDAPLLDRRDDRREVVVEQGHSGGFLADVGSGDAHRDADVGLLERRRIVDAVSGHRDDLTAILPGRHDAQLVCGRDARIHRDVGNVALEIVVAHRVEIPPGHHAPVLEHPELAGDGAGGQRMITRDHHRADACRLADLARRRAPRREGDPSSRRDRAASSGFPRPRAMCRISSRWRAREGLRRPCAARRRGFPRDRTPSVERPRRTRNWLVQLASTSSAAPFEYATAPAVVV